jgi:hypothetical protein
MANAKQTSTQKVRRNPFVGTRISSAKAEFEARLRAIDPNLVKAIKSGTVHTVDCEIYTVRHLASDTTIELMQSADNKKVGITNINNRHLEASTYMLVTGIVLLSKTDSTNLATANEANMAAAAYDVIPSTIANGELEVKVGDKVLYPRNSNERFITTSSDGRRGYVALECPKLIQPLTDIIPTLYLPAAVANTAVKFILVGVRTNKA